MSNTYKDKRKYRDRKLQHWMWSLSNQRRAEIREWLAMQQECVNCAPTGFQKRQFNRVNRHRTKDAIRHMDFDRIGSKWSLR